MRKKSHISLARHIVHVSDKDYFVKHKKAFYVGSILPDCKPSFITKRHEIHGTFDYVTNRIEKLTKGYTHTDELSTMYFTKLGEVIHYIADYFTYPHNKEYLGDMKEHCIYEGKLKHSLRAYISEIGNKDISIVNNKYGNSDLIEFNSVIDICEFIKKEHQRYIKRGFHSVEEDCKYIVGICSKIARAILYVCLNVISKEVEYCIA